MQIESHVSEHRRDLIELLQNSNWQELEQGTVFHKTLPAPE